MIFTREISPETIRLGTIVVSCTRPSIRQRTRMSPWRGSKWMSEAPRSIASPMIECTSLTTGASSADSRTSRIEASSGSSSSSSLTVSPSVESWLRRASMSAGEATARRIS